MTRKQTGSEWRREPHPGLLAGSPCWVVPCAPDAAFCAVHGVAEELSLQALALLVAGRGAGLHHFLICWRQAEGQSPGPGLSCPPATSRSSQRLSTRTHLQTSPLQSGCQRRGCGCPGNLGWGQRANSSDTPQINVSTRFPRKARTALLGVDRERSLPASLEGPALPPAKGRVPGPQPHLTSMRLSPRGQLSAPA